MAPSVIFSSSFKTLLLIMYSCLATITCFSIFSYITYSSKSFNHHKFTPNSVRVISYINPTLQIRDAVSPTRADSGAVPGRPLRISYKEYFGVSGAADVFGDDDRNSYPVMVNSSDFSDDDHVQDRGAKDHLPELIKFAGEASRLSSDDHNQRVDVDGWTLPRGNEEGNNLEILDVYHDRNLFMQEYKEMNRSLKIFVYPVKPGDPFANLLLPVKYEPGGNYASESYFKKNLFKSHFMTKNPSEADLFYLPFSIATLRHDKRIGVRGIPDFVRDYIFNISHEYPYWNRTGGADHFYVACHSIGKTAMKKAREVESNAIQVVCSSSYFLTGYVPNKDASIPQIWPRKGKPPTRSPTKRKKLAFYAGAMNSKERKFLVQEWENDTEISVHKRRLKTPYSEALLGSKFCLHAKGFEVNTARIGDALYYGCVPVILADYYDLPFSDILNWKSFSVVMMSMDIPQLKKILAREVSSENYTRLQRNVMEVRKHFEWHEVPVQYDAFFMAMFELWLRRSHVTLRVN